MICLHWKRFNHLQATNYNNTNTNELYEQNLTNKTINKHDILRISQRMFLKTESQKLENNKNKK